MLSVAVVAKRLELLHELVPKATMIALLVNPGNRQQTEAEISELQAAARTRGLELLVLKASNEGDFETAFTTLVQWGARALVVQTDSVFTDRGNQLVRLAARHAVPVIYGRREAAAAGGLMSYANDLTDRRLLAIRPLNETLHHFPRRFSKGIIASMGFSHSLNPKRTSTRGANAPRFRTIQASPLPAPLRQGEIAEEVAKFVNGKKKDGAVRRRAPIRESADLSATSVRDSSMVDKMTFF